MLARREAFSFVTPKRTHSSKKTHSTQTREDLFHGHWLEGLAVFLLSPLLLLA